MDKLKNVIDGIARIEGKIDGLAKDRRMKLTPSVITHVCEMHDQNIKVAEIGRQMLLLHQVRLSDPTIRKIIKQHRSPKSKTQLRV